MKTSIEYNTFRINKLQDEVDYLEKKLAEKKAEIAKLKDSTINQLKKESSKAIDKMYSDFQAKLNASIDDAIKSLRES